MRKNLNQRVRGWTFASLALLLLAPALVLVPALASVVPTVKWAPPAPMTYGEPLGAAQLNATSSVAGDFVYFPRAGTFFNAGTQQLLAIFFPKNSADYSAVSNTVALVVKRANLLVSSEDVSRAQGVENTQFKGKIAGLVRGDSVKVKYVTKAQKDSPAGGYSIVPVCESSGMCLHNYSVTLNIGQLTITKTNPR